MTSRAVSTESSFRVVLGPPSGRVELQWRACLEDSDLPTPYTAPEYFLEPWLRGKRPLAILSVLGDDVTAVLTGIHAGGRVQSGLSVRPQIALSRHADRALAMRSLVAGLLHEAEYAQLVDLFVWADMADGVDGPILDAGFHRKRYDGVVMLDLTQGADALFRQLSPTRRTDIRRAIRSGVSVDFATSRDDVSAYYVVYVDWARRKGLPVLGEEEFQETIALRRNRRLLVARHGGKVVAGTVLRFFPGGLVEYAANSSLQAALDLRPNDLLQWRAIQWACAEGMTKYSLGGSHLFLRKSGGEMMPTIRYRLDRSILRQYGIGDWVRDTINAARPRIRVPVAAMARSLRSPLGGGHSDEGRTLGRRLSRQLAWWGTRARWTMFDVLHGVDTRAGVADQAAELPPGNLAYIPTPWTVLPRVLRLASLPVHGFSFVDIGCGKGKVLLSALQYPFTRVTGVDFSLPLCRVAGRNLTAARLLRRRCADVQVVNADAAEYVIPAGPAIFFFANPFTDDIMTKVLRNIITSYRASPRPLYLIFYAASSRLPRIEEFLRLEGGGAARQLASSLLGQRTVYVFELPGVIRQIA
jgi:SAM-dependent methyltransferase